MAPLILHNVPDDELYVGEDGVQRPYAMLFPGPDGVSSTMRRKHVPETGSFGKSTRRSRSKSTAPAKREDPTLLASDAIFSQFLSQQPAPPSESLQRKSSLTSSSSQKALAQLGASTAVTAKENTAAAATARFVQRVPTEVILGGFGEGQSYAAINHYEHIGGYICEDYPRDPPMEQRRYKSDLRDPAALRKRALTPEEKAKALRFAGGDHWIKVTFESAEAADAAVYASPQAILGYQVYAELYRGVPPSADDAIPATSELRPRRHSRHNSRNGSASTAFARPPSGTLSRTVTPGPYDSRTSALSSSPNGSYASTTTLDTATVSTTPSSATITGPSSSSSATAPDTAYCRRIPTARRAQLLPAEQALLPQKTLVQRVAVHVPVVSWLSADVIGSAVPRTDAGDFDWAKASLYWKIVWWLDLWFRIFGGDVAGSDKDD